MAMKTLDPAQAFMMKIEDRFKPVHDLTARRTSSVQQFYCGTTVFLTGGSGFLGKHLIEKLLRATDISKIYVLLRCKKGKSIEQRLYEMLKDPLFDTLRQQRPDFADKIFPVSGDVSELKLGLSEKDWNKIVDQVDMIFHLAATTRFDETLKSATFINVRGTREILQIGKACKNLRSFVYVSTAYTYACADRTDCEILEKFYPSPICPASMIGIAESMDEERIKNITKGLIKNWFNTYTFTKAVAEDFVNEMGKDLPLCVVRPAIVISTIREPNPGWLDASCIFGASGLLFAAGLGVLHTMFINTDTQMELIPVDYVNNTILAAAWKTAETKRRTPEENETKIYTVSPSSRNREIWGTGRNILESECSKYLSPLMVGYNLAWETNNPVLFWIYSWLLYLIPAYLVDAFAVLSGQKRRYAKLAHKLKTMSIVLSCFVRNQWKFVDQNTAALYDSLSEDDRQIFNFDVTNIDWTEYIVIWGLGVRKYIMKDGLTGTSYAIKKNVILGIITYIVLPLYFYCLFKIAYCVFYYVKMLFLLFNF